MDQEQPAHQEQPVHVDQPHKEQPVDQEQPVRQEQPVHADQEQPEQEQPMHLLADQPIFDPVNVDSSSASSGDTASESDSDQDVPARVPDQEQARCCFVCRTHRCAGHFNTQMTAPFDAIYGSLIACSMSSCVLVLASWPHPAAKPQQHLIDFGFPFGVHQKADLKT